VWGRIVYIGLPVGLEFVLIAIVMAVIYWVIRDFGAAAQAGFGVGQRVMQSIMLPAMAVSFAAAPIAGQNFGARRPEHVRETFKWSVIIGVALMLMLTALCQFEAEWLMRVFTNEAAVVAIGVHFLIVSSWNFAANAVIFSASSMFQAMGNTWPTIGSSVVRLVVFVGPVLWLSTQPWFELHHVWYVSLVSMFLQAVVSYLLLRREFALRLGGLQQPV
jgi:Na+-driven multidrug efflux pump